MYSLSQFPQGLIDTSGKSQTNWSGISLVLKHTESQFVIMVQRLNAFTSIYTFHLYSCHVSMCGTIFAAVTLLPGKLLFFGCQLQLVVVDLLLYPQMLVLSIFFVFVSCFLLSSSSRSRFFSISRFHWLLQKAGLNSWSTCVDLNQVGRWPAGETETRVFAAAQKFKWKSTKRDS